MVYERVFDRFGLVKGIKLISTGEVKFFTQKDLLKRINNNYEDLTEKTVSWSLVKKIIENNIINELK